MNRTSFLSVSSNTEDLVGLHKIVQLHLLRRYLLEHSLGFTVILVGLPWKMNRDHSVIFEIASKYCIADSFVDHDGYSISSEGFLPSVVVVMVI